MSQFLIASPKHCAKKGLDNVRRLNKRRLLIYALSTFLLALLTVVVLGWLVLLPSKPEFYLKDADVYQLSLVSSPRLLWINSMTVQFTLVSKNPNSRVGVYYDQLWAHASYKGQQITTDSSIPPFYQGHQAANLLSASLAGSGVPVAPSFGYEVGRDQTAGKLPIQLKLGGLLRWKVGTWVSGWYHVEVDCVAIIGFGPRDVSGPLNSKQGSPCSTTV